MIVCADDFGISPAVSDSIVELIERKRISATSCMVIWPEVGPSMQKLRSIKTPCECGLHLVLTGAKPLTRLKPESGLVDFEGNFLPFGKLLKRAYRGMIQRGAVVTEVRAQVQRFVELMGKEPDHIDGHQHVQQLPIVREAIAETVLARTWKKKVYVRVAGLPLAWCCRAAMFHSIGFVVRNLLIAFPGIGARKLMASSDIPHNRFLLGYYDYEGGERFEEIFCRYVILQPRERDVMFCHPGNIDDVLKKRDNVTDSRKDVFEFLCSSRYKELMDRAGIGLNTFFGED